VAAVVGILTYCRLLDLQHVGRAVFVAVGHKFRRVLDHEAEFVCSV
jgi:hypothetical protein